MFTWRRSGPWATVVPDFVKVFSYHTRPEYITGITLALCNSNNDGMCIGFTATQPVRDDWKGKQLKEKHIRLGNNIAWSDFNPKFEELVKSVPQRNIVAVQALETPKGALDACLGVVFYVE